MAKQFEQFTLEPRPTGSNTINGVPVDILDGHLPPPIKCNRCGGAVWLLDAPDTKTAGENRRDPVVMVTEYQRWCVDPEHKARVGKYSPQAYTPHCGHPYHLVAHDLTRCLPGRMSPALPRGLIVRPPRVGEING